MKNKIIKILEHTKIVTLVVLVIVLGLGFFVYKNVGLTPKVNIEKISQDFKDGEVVNLAFPKNGRVNEVSVKAGDVVKKGQILASLDSTDALGALQIAKANYEKVLNGATGADIDVLKTAVKTAEINLENTKIQQELAVKNAHNNLLNSTPEADLYPTEKNYGSPIITGNYNLGKEGQIIISIDLNASFFKTHGLLSVDGNVSTTTPQPIGNSGLFIEFPTGVTLNNTDWSIDIPNTKAVNYLSNNNAYQSALEAQNRLVSLAQANLDQANSALTLKQSSARPEDIASALGSLQVAQGAYYNNFIYASAPGIVSVININPGEIVTVNQKVVSLIVKTK